MVRTNPISRYVPASGMGYTCGGEQTYPTAHVIVSFVLMAKGVSLCGHRSAFLLYTCFSYNTQNGVSFKSFVGMK